MTVRFAHFADLHLGVTTHGHLDPETRENTRVLDFVRALDKLVDHCIDNEADLVLFAGDAYHDRNPPQRIQALFARRVKRLSDAGIPLVLLPGNHDATNTGGTSALDVFDVLAVPGVIVARDERIYQVRTRRGDLVRIGALHYPSKQRLLSREQYRGLEADDIERQLEVITTERIKRLAEQLDPDCPAPSVLLAHLGVHGARRAAQIALLGREAQVTPNALVGPWEYVALGHIHSYQEIPPAVYAGSMERVDFGEEGEPKGFVWVEIERGRAAWQFVDVGARPFITIEADLREAEDPLEILGNIVAEHEIRGAIVRARVQLRDGQSLPHRAVIEMLAAAHHVAAVERLIERDARATVRGLTLADKTDAELFAKYLERRQVGDERAALLSERAMEIVQQGE